MGQAITGTEYPSSKTKVLSHVFVDPVIMSNKDGMMTIVIRCTFVNLNMAGKNMNLLGHSCPQAVMIEAGVDVKTCAAVIDSLKGLLYTPYVSTSQA